MFVSSGQIFVFFACIAFGGISGLAFLLFFPLKAFIDNKILNNVLDFVSMIIITFFYLIFSKIYKFPSVRAYMILGVFIGLFCYFKSFNFMLAKVAKKFYNNSIKHKGRKKYGRTKNEKSA